MKKYNNIILITEMFPYSSSEQFLETEVKYYENYNLTILPQYGFREKRILNSDIHIDNYLVNLPTFIGISKVYYILKGLFSTFFFKECSKENICSISKLKIFLGSMLRYSYYYKIFDTYFSTKTNLDKTILYTYWNTEVTYALQSLKIKYKYKLISRIHGYDIYKHRRQNNYMPLKKQFTNNIDRIYTITESANKYLHDTYKFDYDILELSRLGVEDYNIVSQPNKEGIVHIVSCSYLVEVKQVDKIIQVLAILAQKNIDFNYIWTHIGDGPLSKELHVLADNLLKPYVNLKYNFLGHLHNSEVYDFYKNNNVDVFINVSLSEGVPVSIMEAMSCHIPIIAPDIGGIRDMIDNNMNGILLCEKPSIVEIVDALTKTNLFKKEKVRNYSYKIFLNKYNAKKNYLNFLDSMSHL